MQFWLLTLITQFRKTISKDGVLLAVHTSGASAQSSASHLLTFLVAQLQFLREWKLSDRRLYEVLERRLLIWGNPIERNRRQIQKHEFSLRHPVLSRSKSSSFDRSHPDVLRSIKIIKQYTSSTQQFIIQDWLHVSTPIGSSSGLLIESRH